MNEPIPLETEIPDLEAAATDFESAQAVEAPEPVWTPPAPAPLWPAPGAAPAWAAGSPEAAVDPAPAEDAELPPERVRFSAPLVVVVPGIDEPIDGVIINLSESGLACVLPVALHVDERITCRFRPALGEEHVSVDGEVVWRRRAGGQDSLYGIRFVEVPAAVVERLRVVVRERVEGRAGEWPLPVVPAVAAGARRQRPYVAFAVGVAAGALLSLGISLVPTFLLGRGAPSRAVAQATAEAPDASGTTSTPTGVPDGAMPVASASPQPAPSSAPVAESGPPPAAGPAVTTPSTQAAAKTDVRASVPDAALVPVVVSNPPSARDDHASAHPAPAASTRHAPAEPAAASKEAAPSARAVRGKLAAVASGRALDLIVPLDRAASSVRTFWLDGPRRFVIDVHGARSALDATEYPLPGALAMRLRVGLHGDRVRFVIEATSAAASTAKASLEGSSLLVHLGQR